MLCTHTLSHFTCVWLFATLWTIDRQALLSMGFSKQEYWSGLPCSHPGELPNPGIELKSLMSPALAGWLFTTSATWEAWMPERVIANWQNFGQLLLALFFIAHFFMRQLQECEQYVYSRPEKVICVVVKMMNSESVRPSATSQQWL